MGRNVVNLKLFPELTDIKQRVDDTCFVNYTLDAGGVLTIYRHGEIVQTPNVKPGDALIVTCNGNAPLQVKPMTIPRHSDSVLLWLCGFSNNLRAASQAEFKKILEEQRPKLQWWGYQEYHESARTNQYAYDLVICARRDGRIGRVGAFISGNLPRDVIRSIIEKQYEIPVNYPRHFVEKLLRKNLGFPKTEAKEIVDYLYGSL